jgi:hypothetical protein
VTKWTERRRVETRKEEQKEKWEEKKIAIKDKKNKPHSPIRGFLS